MTICPAEMTYHGLHLGKECKRDRKTNNRLNDTALTGSTDGTNQLIDLFDF
jgi:hypothetical protein